VSGLDQCYMSIRRASFGGNGVAGSGYQSAQGDTSDDDDDDSAQGSIGLHGR
jgi:hypothetical protein